MDYDKAEKIRNKSFGSLLGEQEGGLGASLKSAISQKTQAKMTGIKEKFDPMNIARAVGGKTGAAVYGKVFGRDQKSMERFAGVKKKRISEVDGVGKASGDSSPADVLGLIYRMMLRNAEDDKLQNDLKQNKKEEEDKEENDRNQQLIRALTGRKKEPTRKEKKAERRAERKEEKKIEAEAAKKEAKPEVKPKKEEAPKAPAKAPEKPPAKAPEKPKVEKAPEKPKVEKAPAKAPEVKPKAEKAPEVAAPKPSAARAPVTASKGVAGTVAAGAGVIGTITAGLVAAGITNAYAQKAVIANVGKETGFKPRDEDLAAYSRTSNERIREVFTSRAAKYSDEELNQIKKDPVKFGEMVYGKDTKMGQSMGNTQEGDGYKYRGRGSIQLTGKNNYAAYSKVVNKDLVSNPDLVNDPAIDAAVVAAFVKKGVGNKINDFTDQQTANRAVTQAIGGAKLNLDVGVGAKILSKVDEYSGALSGDKIDSVSKENKDLKVKPNDGAAPITINNTTNTQKNSNAETNKQTIDDRNAYQKKAQG
jgi:predicted chitinase